MARITQDKEVCADTARFNEEINAVFAQFFTEAGDFKGARGTQSTALDMYALHYALMNAPLVKTGPAITGLLQQAWEQTSEQAVKESMESKNGRSLFTFVPDDTA